MLCNGLGRYDEALAAAQQGAAYPTDMQMSSWAMSELVEAAAHCGRPEAADDALRRLAEMARACGTDWILGVEARARALVADGTDADELYCSAIARLGRTRFRAELARTHLVYGEWLRRKGRRREPASSFAPATRCSCRSAWRRSPSARERSWRRPASASATAASRRATT